MRLKRKDEIVYLKKSGSVIPRHDLQMTLKLMGLPPYKTKEKVIVPD